jgi:hypothetical protein
MVRDRAGNTAQSYDGINLDTKPPHSLEITINNGALETTFTNVTINLFALDDLSGVDEMTIYLNSESMQIWEKFDKELSYNLSPEVGKFIIYFNAKDKAGNTAEPVSSSILLTSKKANDKIDNPDNSPQPDSNSDIFLFIILLIIIFLVIITIIFLAYKKDKKKREQIKAFDNTKTIKPLKEFNINPDQLSAVTQQHLPSPDNTKHSVELINTSKSETYQIPQGELLHRPQLPPSQIQTKNIEDSK